MDSLEEKMRQEETEYLQQKIRTNALLDEAAALATKILQERGAEVPTPETEDESEEKANHNARLSTLQAVAVAAYLITITLFSSTTWMFLLFTASLIGVLRWLSSQKKPM
jgi:Flp pilus assembly protein TadB